MDPTLFKQQIESKFFYFSFLFWLNGRGSEKAHNKNLRLIGKPKLLKLEQTKYLPEATILQTPMCTVLLLLVDLGKDRTVGQNPSSAVGREQNRAP